jgi:hypothetical protein
MVELAIHNELANPYVENLSDKVRVHLGLNHTSEDLSNMLELNPEQVAKARDLFSNDEARRIFEPGEEFVLVKEVI